MVFTMGDGGLLSCPLVDRMAPRPTACFLRLTRSDGPETKWDYALTHPLPRKLCFESLRLFHMES